MSKKEDIDFDEELERLSRKTNVSIKKSEYSFNNQINKLDKEMDRIMDKKIKEFDENKVLTSNYLNRDYNSPTIDRYREKLKKI